MESSESDTMLVVGMIENRAKEVGIAALDLRTACLHLSQFIETSLSYHSTKTLLQFYDPQVIILPKGNVVPEGMVGLVSLVGRHSLAKKVELARGCFDDTKGALMLQNLAAQDTQVSISKNYQKQYYLCFGAAAAVLKWIDVDHGLLIARRSLQITFNGSFDHMNIDALSIQHLEVIQPQNYKLGTSRSRTGCLYNLLNTTKTAAGARLLRANLLQPLKDKDTIITRLDTLDELSTNEPLYFGLVEAITKFPKHTDRILKNFCFAKKRQVGDATATTRRNEAIVSAVLLLKTALDVLPVLSEVLRNAKSTLLRNIRDSLFSSSTFTRLRLRVAEVITDDVVKAPKAFASRTQQCFAIKSGVDGLLDLARETFGGTSEAIHALGLKYQKEYDLPKLRLIYNHRHGFHLVFPCLELKQSQLPQTFVQVVKRGKNFFCSTDELMSLNRRNQEAAAVCYTRTDLCLEELTEYVKNDIRYLALFTESLSLLDMMVNSFAAMIITRKLGQCVRPEFTEDGPMAIESGRHPILENLQPTDIVSNNTFMAEGSNMVMITGPNMSGKSTYLRQVALIVIMAHTGCYVPANFASFRIVDRVFTRIGTCDSIELNASTFTTEMRETAFILQNITDRSLVILDELGRGTCTLDGFAIAWSCSEHLQSLKAYTILATHMEGLTELATLYPNVKLCFFSVVVVDKRLQFEYLLKEGQIKLAHYGLMLADISGLPETTVSNAIRIADAAQQKEMVRVCAGGAEFHILQRNYRIAQRLFCLRNAKTSEVHLRNYLRSLKESCLNN